MFDLDNESLFKIGVIVLILVNTGLLISIVVKQNKNKKNTSEGWSSGMGWSGNSNVIANPSATYVTPAATVEPDYGQKTYAGCSCVGYGVKSNRNMKFNNDSNLYAKTIYQGY
jgi:hypothetical protein